MEVFLFVVVLNIFISGKYRGSSRSLNSTFKSDGPVMDMDSPLIYSLELFSEAKVAL